jgi:hypothetical protein
MARVLPFQQGGAEVDPAGDAEVDNEQAQH